MNLLFRFILLALFLPMSALAENPCLVAWGNIDTNLTDNHGCTNEDYPEYRPLCEAFSKCIRSFDICVVSDGEVFGGNSIKDFPLRSASITFGVNRTLATKNHRYCVMGVMSLAPGEEAPSWGYRTFTPNGGRVGEIMANRPENPQSLSTFVEMTKKDFDSFIKRARETIHSPDFNEGDYGFHHGEEP